jgi:cephalosporin hydroxylase
MPTPRTADRNPLETYFYANHGRRLIHKWQHYFTIYHRHFGPFRDRPVTVVELGVFEGGSLQMWRHYFGAASRVIGVDIDPRCADLGGDGIEVAIGDQADPAFLRALAARTGPIDILIDDGGHQMDQQLIAFAELWPDIRDGGLYVVEDLHTSYWPEYGGGYRKPGTFIEMAKGLVDSVHAWHSRERDVFDIDEHTRTIRGMHVYDSVIVFEKGHVEEPHDLKIGLPSRQP